MCTVNKSVHTKKVWKLIECTSYTVCNEIPSSRKDQNKTMIASICKTGLGTNVLLQNGIIGIYWLCDFGQRHSPLSHDGGIKANSTANELDITNTNAKRCPPNCQIGLPLNSSFFHW